MSDFLLSLASPEFLSSAGWKILLLGLAGDVIVLFIPSTRHRLEKALGVLFTVTVFAGVYIERVGDDAFAAQLRERAERAEAELSKFAPRDLPAEKQKRISEAAKPFAGQKCEVAIPQGIDDGFSFWGTLHSALKDAQWEYVAPAANSLWVKGGDAPPVSIPVTSVPGVMIFIDPAKLDELTPVATALGTALRKEGIKTAANVSSYHSNDETKQRTLQIVVGVRAPP